MVIKKSGDKFCVYSKDGSKNLGCFSSLEEAKKRLQQIEYFKSKSDNMAYNDIFSNMAKALNVGGKVAPADIGTAKDGRPRQILSDNSDKSNIKIGTLAGLKSDKVLDSKEHFPVSSEEQAKSSVHRAMLLRECPVWYGGSLKDLRKEVYAGAISAHPKLKENLQVNVPVEKIMALSDGADVSETKLSDVKNPAGVVENQTSTKRPAMDGVKYVSKVLSTETSANAELRSTIGGKLLDDLNKSKVQIEKAIELANKLLSSGLTAEEFESLSSYLQSDILHELFVKYSSTANRRNELLERLKNG